MNSFKHYILAGIVFVLLAGTLAHFLYEWTGNNFIVGLFTPISESTWEHMKLIFFPMFLYSFILIPKFQKTHPCIIPSFLFGILSGTWMIPVIFYTYRGILGTHIFLLDFMTFALSILIAFWSIYRLTLTCRMQKHTLLLYLLTGATLLCFLLFTYHPPDIGLFLNLHLP